MDEKRLQEWSEKLSNLRQERRDGFLKRIQERQGSYSADEHFEEAMSGLDKVVLQWWNLEQASWEENPPLDFSTEGVKLRSELESLVDFELDALATDLEQVRNQVIWNEAQVQKGLIQLKKFADELIENYKIKAGALSTDRRKRQPQQVADIPETPRSYSGGGTKTSAVGLIGMFFVGILIGAGPSVYFMDASNKAVSAQEDKFSKLLAQKKELEDNLVLFHQTFSDLANGKIKNIPDAERDMAPLKNAFKERRAKVLKEFAFKKENVLKKVPAGAEQDNSLAKLEEIKAQRLGEIDEDEKKELEPSLKQITLLKEMMGN